MLTELRFKNWRSLRDVTISNLTPITVFIGANSSGKTNIFDALHFLRRSVNVGIDVAVFNWGGMDKIRTLSASPHDNIELTMTFNWEGSSVSSGMILDADNTGILYTPKIAEDGVELPLPPLGGSWPGTDGQQKHTRASEIAGFANRYQEDRWQLLREDMAPPISLPSDSDLNDPYIIDPRARNLPMMLTFMQQQAPEIYSQLQSDINWLLDHVEKMDMHRDERETRMVINEKPLNGKEAPTISGGTTRLIAMLTAYYALDLKSSERFGLQRASEFPGLVVIEEPDTALNPLLLGNFVDLLRTYVDRKEPRQFILTTHNPRFLDYFNPEEVRVVERDPDTGETSVDAISDSIKDIWLPKHSLGEAWTGRIIGGIPTE
jgi:predicted ATPase